MYYTDITNSELAYFHNMPVHNFTVKLSQILTSPLFKVEEIIANSIYKIYPLFYTGTITSSNSNDKILENKCIICQKTENETFLTFLSDETAEIVDYSEYGTYYKIGDQLTESQFNAYVSLLRQFVKHSEEITISDSITGIYGNYLFDIDGTTLIDSGMIVTDETIQAEPKVKLTDNVFSASKYILKLTILHYTGVNILDDVTPSDFIVKDTLEIELEKNKWINIPVTDLQTDYIIDLNATIEIDHSNPIIQDYPRNLELTGDKSIIQTDEVLDLTATVTDDVKALTGIPVYFYKAYKQTLLKLTGDKSIIQTGEVLNLTAELKDEDGSLVEDETIYFYIPYEPPIVYENDGTDLTTLTIPSGASVTVEDGALKMTTSTTDEKNIAYNYDLNNSDNFIFECEIAKLGTVQSVAIIFGSNASWFAYQNSSNKWDGKIINKFNNIDTGTLAVGDKIKIKQENGVITLYHNDTVIYSETANLGSNFKIGHYTNSGRIQYIKNIKIIDLNEE